MDEITEYHILMKILEIMELKHRNSITLPTEHERVKIVTLIKNIEGNLLLNQTTQEDTVVNIEGDKFDNINNSIIATRGSIASGIIKIREAEGEEVADALQQLDQAIAGVDPKIMPEEDKQKALKLLEELTKQVSAPSRVKVVLETLGKGLWEVIKGVGPVVKTATIIWPIIQKLWT